jgi:hypothetical protein
LKYRNKLLSLLKNLPDGKIPPGFLIDIFTQNVIITQEHYNKNQLRRTVMNNMENRLKIKKLWYSLLPGDIICDSATSGEKFTATILSVKQEASYCISVFSFDPKIKSVSLGIFNWHHKTNLVVSEKNIPVPFFNEPFGIKKAKNLMSQKDPFELASGGYNLTNEELEKIYKKIEQTCKNILRYIDENPEMHFTILNNFIMNAVFGPGSYTKEQYVLIGLIVNQFRKKLVELSTEKIGMEVEKKLAIKKLRETRDALLKIQSRCKPRLLPPIEEK